MRRFIARRLVQAVAIIFGVSLVTFGLLHATGDPVALLLPLDATQAERDRLRTQLGLDDPLVVQYWRFVSGAVRGDFGRSIRQSEPALGLVLERLPATLELTASRPMPGQAKIVSVMTAPPSRWARSRPSTVTTGSRPLRRACRRSTSASFSPLALAVRT